MDAAEVPLTVAQTLRYNPVIQALRQRLPEMGELYSFTANQRLEPSTLAWHDDQETAGAGVLFHTAIHVFDALREITGLKVEAGDGAWPAGSCQGAGGPGYSHRRT